MSALSSSDFIAVWTAKMQAAAAQRPAVAFGFDGRVALSAWLAESAHDQAERVFLVLDGTPVEARDMVMAERLMSAAGASFLEAWGWAMAAFSTDDEPWASEAAEAAVKVYRDRLVELAPSIHAGGAA